MSSARTRKVINLTRTLPIQQIGTQREYKTESNNAAHHKKQRISGHRVKDNNAGNEVQADKKRRRIEFSHTGTNDPENRYPEPAHQHSGYAWKNITIVRIGLENLQRTIWCKQEPESDNAEIGAQIEQTESCLVHFTNPLRRITEMRSGCYQNACKAAFFVTFNSCQYFCRYCFLRYIACFLAWRIVKTRLWKALYGKKETQVAVWHVLFRKIRFDLQRHQPG